MKKIIILGGGESGISAALLAKKRGEPPFVSDSGHLKPWAKECLEKEQIEYEENGHSLNWLSDASLVIKSPGIPDNSDVVKVSEANGLPIISEIEYVACMLSPRQLIGITGSNGKTTTTTLINLALNASNIQSTSCGNIGDSLARTQLEVKANTYVIELSSFQLDRMYEAHLHIALLLNITPDHLDRYDHELMNYARAKWRIFQNQTEEDFAIINADDAITNELLKESPLRKQHVLTFSCKSSDADAFFDGTDIYFKTGDVYHFSNFLLKGEHNAQNLMATGLALQAYGLSISSPRVVQALSTFGGVRHRTQMVGEWRGVTFINDSKGTNLDATIHALGAMPDGKTILILGGTDKGNDYSEIYDLVKLKVKALIFLTLDTEKLIKSFEKLNLPTSIAHSMQEAFKQISQLKLNEGDVVLLSPACASFDLFNNYEDRGDQFIDAFYTLKQLN